MAVKKGQSKLVTAVAVLLLVAGAAFIYWLYFLKPSVELIGDLGGEIAALESEIDSLNQKQDQKAIIEQRWQDLQKKEPLLKTRIPGAAELPRVMGTLDQLLRDSPLTLESLDAGELTEGERYRTVPVSLKVSGARKEVLLFLKDLEQFPHLVLIDQAVMERSEKGYRLSVSFRLIFIFGGGAEEVGAEETEQA